MRSQSGNGYFVFIRDALNTYIKASSFTAPTFNTIGWLTEQASSLYTGLPLQFPKVELQKHGPDKQNQVQSAPTKKLLRKE